MLQKSIIIITIVSIIALSLLVNFTTPATIGPLGILVIFICSYVAAIGITTYLLYGLSWIGSHLLSVFSVRGQFEALSFRRAYYYSTIIAAAPIMLIGLQSVGAVGVYEFVLVTLFVVLGCLYVTKTIH